MSHKERADIFLIGIGNEFRQDDGAGILTVRALKVKNIAGVAMAEHRGEGLDLLELWKGYSTVFLIDAVSSGGKPGTIYRVEIPPEEIPKDKFCCSTHAMSVAEGIALAQAIHQIPEKLIIYGIEGKSFDHGPGFSQEVQSAVRELTARITEEIKTYA
ncbi:MAG: hypothetical protein A2Z81_06440 [Omnitrophica WOR_2 bacterium GWA2_45_18]|nr:MAG: hypothetical protein A2Z81_06440 [Omnitrophica WOR_2 bacterium GWA2_45_18]